MQNNNFCVHDLALQGPVKEYYITLPKIYEDINHTRPYCQRSGAFIFHKPSFSQILFNISKKCDCRKSRWGGFKIPPFLRIWIFRSYNGIILIDHFLREHIFTGKFDVKLFIVPFFIGIQSVYWPIINHLYCKMSFFVGTIKN